MNQFGYTPEIGQVQTFTPRVKTRSKLGALATDLSNLLTAREQAKAREAKREKQYLDDEAKERLNDAQSTVMDLQDTMYEQYNTTADPEKRNQFVQEFEDNATKVGMYYGVEGDDLLKFTKGYRTTLNKLRLYNSNVLGKVNDTINTEKATVADFSTMDVITTKDMDATIIENNRAYLVTTKFGGDTARYFNSKFSDYGVKVKEAVAGSTSPEEITTLLTNLDIFADKLGDKVSVKNKDATTDSTMYNEYHKLRQHLLEKQSAEVTKLKTSLNVHRKGNNKKAFMETVERIDNNNGFENLDLKQSTIDSWTTRQSKANTAKINAMKRSPDFVTGYIDPKVIETTYRAHGGTDEAFITEYRAKHTFTQNYMVNPINSDLSANPQQAKIVAEDLVKKLILSGDVATAVDYASKTGVGGVLSSFASSAVGETNPEVLTQNVSRLMEGYNRNMSTMGNNMTTDAKSAMLFYNYQMRSGTPLNESHIARVTKGNEEGITPKGSKEFNDEFAGKHNYAENLAIYSALVKYQVPPEVAMEYIQKDNDSHLVSVSTGIFSSMEVDMRHSPKGVSEYSSSELEEVLSPLVERVDNLDIEGDKKLVYDPSIKGFRLYVNEIPMDATTMNIETLVDIRKKEKLLEEQSPWAITMRKVSDMWDGALGTIGETINQGIANLEVEVIKMRKNQIDEAVIRISTNKALKAEKAHTDPKYVGEVFKQALYSRENASALFNKDGINDYINFLNAGFSPMLAEPLTVSNTGKAVIEGTPMDVTSPEGRKELEKVIKEKITPLTESEVIKKKTIKLSYTVKNKDDFVSQVKPEAERVAKKLGEHIQADWLVNMWRHETGNGSSKVTKNTFNLGNIKAQRGYIGNKYDAGKVWEMRDGKNIREQSYFRKYNNFTESADDYISFLMTKRYSKVRQAKTKLEFYTELSKAGYATDVNYVKSLMRY